MAAAEAIRTDRSKLIKLAFVIGIPVLIMLIPVNDVFTPIMRQAIAITVGFLIWAALDLTDLLIPSLIWSALLVFTGTVPATTVFSPFLSTLFYGASAMMIFATILARIGVLTRVAYWIAAKTGGEFTKLTYGVFFAVFGIAMITFTGGVIVAAAFIFGVCKSLDLIGKKEAAVLTMTGILATATVRMFWAYPVTIGMVNSSVQAVNPDFAITFDSLFMYNWPTFFFCLICVYVLLIVSGTRKIKIEGAKEYFQGELAKMGKLSRDEKIGVVALVGVMIWIITGSLTGGDMMIGYCFFSMLMFVPGIDVGTKEDIKAYPLGTLIFIMACISVGTVSNAVGIVDAMKTLLTPMLASMGSTWSLFAVVITAMVGNLGMTINAMLGGFSGMIYSIFEGIGMNPTAGIFAWNMGCDLVFFPYEYSTPLLFLAFGTMSNMEFLKMNIIKNILFIVFFGIVMVPFWALVGLI